MNKLQQYQEMVLRVSKVYNTLCPVILNLKASGYSSTLEYVQSTYSEKFNSILKFGVTFDHNLCTFWYVRGDSKFVLFNTYPTPASSRRNKPMYSLFAGSVHHRFFGTDDDNMLETLHGGTRLHSAFDYDDKEEYERREFNLMLLYPLNIAYTVLYDSWMVKYCSDFTMDEYESIIIRYFELEDDQCTDIYNLFLKTIEGAEHEATKYN